MIRGLAVLLLCQLLGEIFVDLTGLAVPGPVVGMVLLFGWLQWRRPVLGAATVRAANGLLKHLQLFFVPAGVGVIAHAAVLRQDALPITVALVGSWLAGLLVVGWIVQATGREHGDDAGRPPGGEGRD